MAEYKDIIHTFSRYCSSIVHSDKQCYDCEFHYLKNDMRAGCIDYLVKYPDEAERFLTDWEKKHPEHPQKLWERIKGRFNRSPQDTEVRTTCDDTYTNICTCNLCGKRLDEYDQQGQFGFEYYIGYGSKYDLQRVRARFCCECFDKLLDDLVARCVTSPLLGEYELLGEKEIDKELISELTEQ